MSAYQFRPITPADAELLYQLRHDAITTKGKDTYPADVLKEWAEGPGIDWQEKYTEDALDPDNVGLLVFYKDQPVGFGQIKLQERTLDTLYVAPFTKDKDDPSAGSILLNKLEQVAAHDHGVTCLMMDATVGAVPFYEKHDWMPLHKKPIKRVMEKYGENRDLVLTLPCIQMMKTLNLN